MYKLVVGLRYLRSRWITVWSILFVALGVMALIVVNSVFGGFEKEFRSHLRSTLSHLSVTFERPDYAPKLASRLRDTEGVAAVSHRKQGLVLLARGEDVKGCRVIGIEPSAEFAVSRLESQLVTPYQRWRERLAELVNRNEYMIQWELLGVATAGERPVAYMWQVETDESWPKPRRELISLRFDADQRVEFVQLSLTAGDVPSDIARAGTPQFAEVASWVDRASSLARKRAIDELLPFFRPDFTLDVQLKHKIIPLDPKKPFLLAGGRVKQEHPGLIVGVLLFKEFRLLPGDEVELVTARENPETKEYESVSKKFTVTGMVKTGMNDMDKMILYAPRSEMVGFLEPRRGNLFGVALDDHNRSDELKATLQSDLAGKVYVETWEDAYRPLLRAVAIEKRVMSVILAFFILFAVVTIAVILILLVVERVRDIGILKSMGATPGGIAKIFVFNGMVAGAVGSILGTIGGWSFATHINEIAAWVYNTFDVQLFPRDVYHLDRIPVDVDPLTVLAIVGVAMTLCLLCSLGPAWKAARLPVVRTIMWD